MISLALQGIHDYPTSSIKAFEVLARIKDGDSWMSPPSFLASSSEDAWVELDQAVLQLLTEAKGITIGRDPIFLNVSPATLSASRQFSRYLAKLEELVRRHHGPIVVELPELLDMTDLQLQSRLRHFRAVGAAVALDDFGSGRANLDRLLSHQWDYCKIERDAMLDVSSREDCTLAIQVCKQTKTGVVLERVDKNCMSYECFRGVKDVWVQGFDWSRPELYEPPHSADMLCRRFG